MDIKHHEPGALPRQKRIKVSKACYTCRVKKIKCDGLIPCMQCKARQRTCSFSTDGTGESNYPPPPTSKTTQSISTSSSASSPSLPSLPSSSHQNSKSLASGALHEKQVLDSTTQRLDTLGQSWPGCEYEDSERYQTAPNQVNPWAYQHPQQRQKQQIPDAPPLSFFLADSVDNSNSFMTAKVVTSTSNIQHNLLSLYYRHRHPLLPLLPKSSLHTLLAQPSPEAFVSPLLLNTLYAHAAQASSTFCTDADRYATTAKSMLDDYMDTPHLSTVIALVLLALYESNRQGYTTLPFQTSMYSAMAIRMCFDLRLHMGNGTDVLKMTDALKLRVFWCCYCLDKWANMGTGRPWMIHSIDIGDKMELNEQAILRMEGLEMDHDEHTAMEGLIASIQLAQLGEHLLRQPSSSTLASINTALQADQQLLPFLHRLPASLQWTPLPTPDSLSSPTSSLYQPIPSHPPHNAIVGHLHLIFNYLHLELLTRPLLTMTTPMTAHENHHNKVKKDQVSLLLQRCATVATNLTQLGCALTDQTGFILCYRWVAQALMLSARVHLIQCYGLVMQPALGIDYHLRPSKHARLMFQRSLRSLRILVQHRVISGADQFATFIERTLATLSPLQHDNHPHLIGMAATESPSNSNTEQQQSSTFHHASPNQYKQSPQQHEFLNGVEQSAAEILSNAFNTNTQTVNKTTKGTSSPSSTYTSMRPKYHPEQQQQTQPLVDVASLYTSAANNPLYHQSPQQIQPHYGYSLTSGKQDEVWALQEQYQQQQQQQQYHPSTLSSSATNYEPMNMYSTPLWQSPSSTPSSSPSSQLNKKSTKPVYPSSPSASSSTSAHTSISIPSATPTTSSTLGMGSSPYKNIGLGVYASAHRHHSDVIGQHLSSSFSNGTENHKGNNNKTEHRPVILNCHGQVVVASSSSSGTPSTSSPSSLLDIQHSL